MKTGTEIWGWQLVLGILGLVGSLIGFLVVAWELYKKL